MTRKRISETDASKDGPVVEAGNEFLPVGDAPGSIPVRTGPAVPVRPEKVLALVRAGVAAAMFPERNKKHLEDIPPDSRQRSRFVWRHTVDDAVAGVLEPPKAA